MKQLLEEAKLLQEQIVADRRYLHQIPEVGMDLPESAAYIEKRLAEMGIESHRCGVMEESTAEVHQDGFPRYEGIYRRGSYHRQRQSLHPAAG